MPVVAGILAGATVAVGLGVTSGVRLFSSFLPQPISKIRNKVMNNKTNGFLICNPSL
jgi:hypothetical protein